MRWSALCDDQSTVHTQLTPRRLPILRVCAMFEGLREICFVFRFGFRATLLDFTSRIRVLALLQLMRRCMKSFRAFLYRIQSRTPIDSACIAVFMTRPSARSVVRAQLWLLQRLLGLFVAMSYDPLTHSRHNAGDRSAKVGHEIMYINGWF